MIEDQGGRRRSSQYDNTHKEIIGVLQKRRVGTTTFAQVTTFLKIESVKKVKVRYYEKFQTKLSSCLADSCSEKERHKAQTC